MPLITIMIEMLVAMVKMVKLSKTDLVLKDCMEKIYQTDDLAGWIQERLKEYPADIKTKLNESELFKGSNNE